MNCGVGHRYGLDPVLLWLWCRLVAIALIRPLAWESPYAETTALKRQKTNIYICRSKIGNNNTKAGGGVKRITLCKSLHFKGSGILVIPDRL